MRRFKPGDTAHVGGLAFKIERGKKRPRGPGDDLRLDWYTPDGWRPIPLAALALMVDFWCENESVLYPPPQYQGGGKVWKYLRDAQKLGWRQADAGLRMERAAKPSLFDDGRPS